MKRFLTALLIGGVLFTAAFGAAASLNVGGGIIQGGKDTSLACQTSGNPVEVVWKTCAGGGGDARIFGLELSNFDGACNGQYVLAYLLDNTGNFPGSGSGMWRASATISGGTVTVDQYGGGSPWVWTTATCGTGPLVSEIYQVHLIVKNAWASSDAP